MHMCIALMLLWRAFGSRARVTGGDTDSMKVSTDEDITDSMLLEALEPLARASKDAIDRAQTRVRKLWPEMASDLKGIGGFDLEPASRERTRYDEHMDVWNKARVSVVDGCSHITCAGLSRPDGAYHIETYIDELLRQGHAFAQVAPAVLGYNVEVSHGICHALQQHRPLIEDRYIGDVTDYLGRKSRIDLPQAVALYPVSRELGETVKRANAENVRYLEAVYGREVDTRDRVLTHDGGRARIEVAGEYGETEELKL